jgi:glycogenin glucosyltransferase
MDADTLVMQNIDDLFEREEFSAAPDPGWPDCFNSGVFVFRPSDETFQNLMEFAMTHGTFDGGDQGLLNLFFSDWATKDISRHLPFVYNCVSMAFYSYLPAFKQFGKNVKVAHFIGASKPWHYAFNPSTGQVEDVDASGGHAQEFLQMWWRIFVERVKASLEGGMMGLSEELGSLRIATPPAGHQGSVAVVLDDPDRQFRWEQGQIDYLGVDSFENIKAKLDQSIKEKDTEKVPTKASVKAGKTPDRSSPQNKSKGPKEPSPAK